MAKKNRSPQDEIGKCKGRDKGFSGRRAYKNGNKKKVFEHKFASMRSNNFHLFFLILIFIFGVGGHFNEKKRKKILREVSDLYSQVQSISFNLQGINKAKGDDV